MLSSKAIHAISIATELDNDISEFLLEELVTSKVNNWKEEDEEQLSNILGEHLVNFGVSESIDLSWIICDKILKQFDKLDVPLDLLSYDYDNDYDDNNNDNIIDLPKGLCPICTRNMPLTFHHLFPKSTHKKMIKEGYTKDYLNSHGIDLCRPCHSQIHRLIPLNEMAQYYNSLERILENTKVQKWIPYIKKQKLTSKCDVRTRIQTRNLILPKEDEDSE